MRRTQRIQLICLLLSAILVVGLMPTTAQAEGTAENRFILVAESKTGLIIAPTYVYHSGGTMTMLEALANSGFIFTGIENGMVTAIDGVVGSFTRSDEDGDYAFTKYAVDVSHYCFSERPSSESRPSEGLMLLMTAMADYLEEDPDVQKAAKDQYQEARKQFVAISNDSDSAKTLAKSLTDAVNNYKAILSGETYEIRFVDGNKEYSGVTISAVNSYGKQWVEDKSDGIIELPYGSYTFCVSHNGYSVSGIITVPQMSVVDVKLPQEQMLKLDTFRLSGSYGADDNEKSKFTDAEISLGQWKDRSLTVPVLDSFSGTVYSYVECDDSLLDKSQFDKEPVLTAVYTMKNETADDVEKKITLASLVSGANYVLAKGAEGNTVIYRLSWKETDGYIYSQDYTVNFARIPTLASITVQDQDGTDLAATTVFDSRNSEYIYKVLDTVNKVKLSALPLVESYDITVNGIDAKNGISIDINKDTVITITVSANGFSNTYSLNIQPGKGQTLIFSSMKEVTLQVVNSNGVEIPYTAYKETDNSNRYRFTLVPGEKYRYIATYDTYYHIADDLELEVYAGEIIKVDFADTDDWLTELAFGTFGKSGFKGTIPMETIFSKDNHRYQIIYEDTEYSPYVWVSSIDKDMDIQALYNQVSMHSAYHGKEQVIELKSGKSSGVNLNRFLIDENPVENSVIIRLTKEINGVTHFQDYVVDFQRALTMRYLTATCDGIPAMLVQERDQSIGFVPSVKEYYVKVSAAAKTLTLDLLCYADNLCFGEDSVGYRVSVKEKDKEILLEEAGSAVIELDGSINTQTVTLTVENDKSPAGTATYVLKILKAPPVETTFSYFPQSALLNLREVLSGERLWPDEQGKYLLCEGYSYDYVLSEYGYVSKAGRLKVTQNQEDELVILDGEREYSVTAAGDGGAAEIAWDLTAAVPNEKINSSITSSWPNFRGGSSNNAVTTAKVPTAAESGTLYWANQIGSGIDSDAVGSPILVGGDIITYASDKLYRVDTVTGAILAEGNMDHKSSFSITPPTYAEGMVFVALSNGCVQAFNAATLESLWVYNDPLGGQPNCPLTVKDGYLYTGFWNSETGNANFVCLSITDEKPEESKEEKYASWFYTAKGGYYWAGAYAGSDFILIGTDDGDSSCISQTSRMLLLNAKTGKLMDSWDNLNGDIRSTVVYDGTTNAYYFTSKGGSFYSFQVSEQKITNQWSVPLDNGIGGTPMSTCSPVVYNGRAYIGVSGSGQFTAYSGHNITVIDLINKSIAYSVPTQGYPQTSGLLTTAYESDTGYVYVYFFDNYTPGKLRVLRDRSGQRNPDYCTEETVQDKNGVHTLNTAYALFTPSGNQAQYAICSPIVDDYGTVFFKNDSAHLMAFGSTVKELIVDMQNTKTEYLVGETFDPSGMQVTAVYSNGKTRDVTNYVTFSTNPLTLENPKVTISYSYGMYQNQEKENSQEMLSGITTPTAKKTLELTVTAGKLGDADCNGTIDLADAELILDYEAKLLNKELNPMVADVSGDGKIDSNDAVLISQFLEGKFEKFPAAETVEENQPTE